MKYKYVLIGLGEQMLGEYVPYLKNSNAEIVSTVDPCASDDKRVVGVPHYRDLSRLPEAKEDVIALIAIPHDRYAAVICRLIDIGYRNIVMEKPASIREDEFFKTDEYIKRHQALVFVLSRRRHSTANINLKRDLSCAYNYDAMSINISRVFARSSYTWRSSKDIAGATIMFDLGYHALDLLHWMVSGDTVNFRLFGRCEPHACYANSIRASFSVAIERLPFPVSVYVDRLAPSPFEQITLVGLHHQAIATPYGYFRGDRHGETSYVPNERQSETHRMFADIEAFVTDRDYKRRTALYSEHCFHVRAASQLRPLGAMR